MEKLAAYIKDNHISQAEAAKAIGCSGSALSLWLRGLRQIETIEHVIAIEDWTKGAVTLRDLAKK